jgi:hypothetical protein
MMARLQLSWSTEFNRFVLRDPYLTRDDTSYEMVIERPYADEWRYRFLIWEDGEWQECITSSDFKQRVQDVRDHEGDAVATIWEVENTYNVVQDNHAMFNLQRKWEALMELNIFDIPVNHDTWKGKPMSQEAMDAMNDAHEQEMRAAAEEMAEAMKEGKS